MKKCPICNNYNLKIKLGFRINGKQVIKYSCDKCDYFKQEVIDYMMGNLILKNMHSYTAGGNTVGRMW